MYSSMVSFIWGYDLKSLSLEFKFCIQFTNTLQNHGHCTKELRTRSWMYYQVNHHVQLIKYTFFFTHQWEILDHDFWVSDVPDWNAIFLNFLGDRYISYSQFPIRLRPVLLRIISCCCGKGASIQKNTPNLTKTFTT